MRQRGVDVRWQRDGRIEFFDGQSNELPLPYRTVIAERHKVEQDEVGEKNPRLPRSGADLLAQFIVECLVRQVGTLDVDVDQLRRRGACPDLVIWRDGRATVDQAVGHDPRAESLHERSPFTAHAAIRFCSQIADDGHRDLLTSVGRLYARLHQDRHPPLPDLQQDLYGIPRASDATAPRISKGDFLEFAHMCRRSIVQSRAWKAWGRVHWRGVLAASRIEDLVG